jgi:cytochrome c5
LSCGSGFSRDLGESRLKPLLQIALIVLPTVGTSAAAQLYATVEARPYRVECAVAPAAPEPESATTPVCRTDLATFLGKRTFDEYCASCHARDALGSTFAPSLAERVRRLDRAQFMGLLERGYGGEAAAMTRWADVPAVRSYADALWAYLSARAAGDLPPGPIELLPDADRP